MISRLKHEWEQFKCCTPGQRFVRLRESRQDRRQSPLVRVLFIGGGLALIVAGLVMLAMPGPGSLVLLLGAGLIAHESMLVARGLDWFELRARKVADWCLGTWRGWSRPVKALFAIVCAAAIAGVGYAVYQMFFAG